jgi:hypothetical protein
MKSEINDTGPAALWQAIANAIDHQAEKPVEGVKVH